MIEAEPPVVFPLFTQFWELQFPLFLSWFFFFFFFFKKRNILGVTVLALLGPRDASKGALQSTAWLECWALGDEELMLLNRGVGEDS